MLFAVLYALPLPEAVDLALARWPRTGSGILAVTVSFDSDAIEHRDRLRTDLIRLVQGRAREAGLAETVLDLPPGKDVTSRAQAAGAEHLLQLELGGNPIDVLRVTILAVDPGGLWGPKVDPESLPIVARTHVAIEPEPFRPPGGPTGTQLVFVTATVLPEPPLALAACRDAEGIAVLVILLSKSVLSFPIQTGRLGPPHRTDVAWHLSPKPVRAPYGHAICAPGSAGAVAIGQGRSTDGFIMMRSPARVSDHLNGLPLASDGHSIILGHPTEGTNVLESKLGIWPDEPRDALSGTHLPVLPEPSRRIFYDRQAGWLFMSVRGPMVDASGRERIPSVGDAVAVADGQALVSAPELIDGEDEVRLWDLGQHRWLSEPYPFSGPVRALALMDDLAFAAVTAAGTDRLYLAHLPHPSRNSEAPR